MTPDPLQLPETAGNDPSPAPLIGLLLAALSGAFVGGLLVWWLL